MTSQAGAFGYLYRAGSASREPIKLLLPNTSYITNTYDSVARLAGTFLDNSGNTVLDSSTYGYNKASQRTTFTNAAGTYVQYSYDNIGQIKVAASSSSIENLGYAYDAAWNISYTTNNGILGTDYVDIKNELTNANSYLRAYDANGNCVTNNGYISYTYDAENRLSLISDVVYRSYQSGFVYDGMGRLRTRNEFTWNGSKWVVGSTVNYLYDGKRVIQERDGSNNPNVSYTRGTDLSGTMEGAGGIGGLLGRSSGYSAGNWTTNHYYHADGNGNIMYLVDSSQGMAATYRYDPFGNSFGSSGPLASANVYQFSSKELHRLSGMYYFLYRFYDPSVRRWLNRDPLGEPGFETLHLVSQPLFIRKLRLNVNDSEMQYFLAMAMQNGSIDVSGYLRNSHSSYRGNRISALAFFNLLRGGQGTYAPNWPVELLEYPNLYGYVGNDPIDGGDPFGLWHWYNPISWPITESIWEGIKTGWGDVGTFIDGPECMSNIAPLVPNMVNRNHGIMTNSPSGSDGDYNPPMQNGGGNGSFNP